jgi:hypothetical protein
MRIGVDGRFVREAEEYQLRFTCETCLHFLRATDRCAHGWPNEEHREVPKEGQVVTFCKEFEVI